MTTETTIEIFGGADLSGRQVLRIMMKPNDANVLTIGEYLISLAAAVWENGEGFSGKRPFGNSGWEYELYESLAHARVIKAKLVMHAEDGDFWTEVEHFDKSEADRLIEKALDELFRMVRDE